MHQGDPLYVGMDITIASFDAISEVNMVSRDHIFKIAVAQLFVSHVQYFIIFFFFLRSFRIIHWPYASINIGEMNDWLSLKSPMSFLPSAVIFQTRSGSLILSSPMIKIGTQSYQNLTKNFDKKLVKFQFPARCDREECVDAVTWWWNYRIRSTIYHYTRLYDGFTLLSARQPKLHSRNWKL